MPKNFVNFLELNEHIPVAIAVSGGVDSMYLMHWCAKYLKNATVLTVNHGLRAVAESETKFVAESAKSLGLKCEILKWVGKKPTCGIEEAARCARYDLLTNYCKEHGIGILLTAHHADDNIETFLMNLGRGSGVYGLAGIRHEIILGGVRVVRPMLDISRSEILEYAKKHKIKFVSDEMNENTDFVRVKIRKSRHLITDKLGISDARILLAIDSLNRVREDLENQILSKTKKIAENGYKFFVSDLNDLSEELQLKLLSMLIQDVGKLSYPPRLQSVQKLLYNVRNRAKMTMTLGRCAIRRLDDKLLIVPEGTSVSFIKKRK